MDWETFTASEHEPGGVMTGDEAPEPAAFVAGFHPDGVADVRLVVYRGYPVVALARVPTEASSGSVSLYHGAIGVRLSVTDGTALGACRLVSPETVTSHPDTGVALADLRIPNWGAVVDAATRAVDAPGICHLVDVTLAVGDDPVVLAVESRPGLAMQGTGDTGLFRRLRFVNALPDDCDWRPLRRRLEDIREWTRAEFSLGALPGGVDVRLGSTVGGDRDAFVGPSGRP
jgi:hypothetical protein